MNSITKLVSGNIVMARKLARLKQSELATLLGVTTQSISEWERGNTDPSHKKLEAMGQALGLTGSGLWFYQDQTGKAKPEIQVARESREDLFNRFLDYEKRNGTGPSTICCGSEPYDPLTTPPAYGPHRSPEAQHAYDTILPADSQPRPTAADRARHILGPINCTTLTDRVQSQ